VAVRPQSSHNLVGPGIMTTCESNDSSPSNLRQLWLFATLYSQAHKLAFQIIVLDMNQTISFKSLEQHST
jgi:hypothetical protein